MCAACIVFRCTSPPLGSSEFRIIVVHAAPTAIRRWVSGLNSEWLLLLLHRDGQANIPQFFARAGHLALDETSGGDSCNSMANDEANETQTKWHKRWQIRIR
jgi:hypothetical protein